MKLSLNVILILIAIGLFFVGRWTGPKHVVVDTHKIDSLIIDKKQAELDLAVFKDSVNQYKLIAHSWQLLAADKKERIVIQKIYAKDTAHNRSLSVLQRDSLIRTIFLVK